MIPSRIREHLDAHGAHFHLVEHPHAVSAQRLAEALHVSGYEVAKSVVVSADGQPILTVLPAPTAVDTLRLAWMLGAFQVDLADEETLQGMFPDCELGAEPPFGRLYGLPVLVDPSLRGCGAVIMRAGSHTQALQIPFEDFWRIEQPRMASFALRPGHGWAEAWSSLL